MTFSLASALRYLKVPVTCQRRQKTFIYEPFDIKVNFNTDEAPAQLKVRLYIWFHIGYDAKCLSGF